MQLVALKHVVAVADYGSFTAAAERRGVSASTLTRSVSTLEDNLGLRSSSEAYVALLSHRARPPSLQS